MTHSRTMALIGGLTMWLTPVILQAGPIEASRHPHPKNIEMVHRAEHSVDHAWEVYHRAALGGTVASRICKPESNNTCMKPERLCPRRKRPSNEETVPKWSVL